jgi:hypothetical protein
MASFKNLVSTTSAQISSGGTITGDLVINGDLQVDGGGSLSFDEIVQGTQVVEITDTEALLVRKASDGGDVFIVDTQNSKATIGGNLVVTKAESSASEFISALEINRDFASATSTDLFTGMIFTDDNSVQAGIFTNRYASHANYNSKLQFYVNNSSSSMTPETALGNPAMVIDGSKNIGIGTSSPATNAKLHVVDGAGTAPTMHTGDMVVFQNNNDTSDNAGIVVVSGTGSGTSNGLSYITFGDSAVKNQGGMIYYNGNDSLEIRTNATSAINIDSSQNVGIGNSGTFDNPNSASKVLEIATSSPVGLILNDTRDANPFCIENRGAVLHFAHGTTSRLIIDDSGNVGIGASPQTGFTQNLTIEGASPALILRDSTSSNQATQFYTVYTANNAVKHYFDHAGSLNFASSTDYAGSGEAIRFKIDDNSRISLSNNDSGFENTIFGKDAGKSIVSGADKNAFFGAFVADATLTDGADFNAGFGYGALSGLTSGAYNTALGSASMLNSTTGSYNVAIGNLAMGTGVTTGNGYNVAIGYKSGENLTSGGNSVMIGNEAGNGVSTSYYHVLIGDHAGHKTLADHGTVAVGYYALANATSGGYNTAIGYQSLEDNVSGEFNTAVGYQTLKDATGQRNSVLGYQALFSTTVAGNSVAVGRQAGYSVSDHGNNVYIGDASGYHQTGESNVFIGKDAGLGASGADNDGTVSIGFKSLESLTSGSGNTAVGYQALDATTTQNNSTAIGYNAGGASAGNSNLFVGYNAGATGTNDVVSGTQNTIVGTSARASSASAQGQIVLGVGAVGQGDHTAVIGGDAVTDVYMAQDRHAKVHMGDFHLQNGTAFTFNDNASHELCSFEARFTDSPTGTTGSHIAFRASADDFTSGTETARIANIGTSGNINANHSSSLEFHVISGHTMTKTLTVGSNDGTDRVQLHKGRLQFPATQNADADANTLDDYEEGTFTPTITVATGSAGLNASFSSGEYTKIGNLVTAIYKVRIGTRSTSPAPSGALDIALPFTTGSGSGANSSSGTGVLIGEFNGDTDGTLIALASGSDASILRDTDGNFNNDCGQFLPAVGGYIHFSVQYTVD